MRTLNFVKYCLAIFVVLSLMSCSNASPTQAVETTPNYNADNTVTMAPSNTPYPTRITSYSRILTSEVVSSVEEFDGNTVDTSNWSCKPISIWQGTNFLAYKTMMSMSSSYGAYIYQFGRLGLAGTNYVVSSNKMLKVETDKGKVFYFKSPGKNIGDGYIWYCTIPS